VRRIRDNGNRAAFNFYGKYHMAAPLAPCDNGRLLDTVLGVQERDEEAVVAHPYYIRALVAGRSDCASRDAAVLLHI
jgi:hypothetical protein